MAEVVEQKDRDVLHAEHHNSLGNHEKGAAYVADTDVAEYVDPTVVLTEAENKALRWKVFTRVLPVMCVAYITQSLDKGALGPASIMGWQADVGAVGQDYALTSTFLYVGIIIGEPIVNQCIRKFPVAKILAYSMVVWTGLLFGITFSLNVKVVFVLRALLGFFESSFNPCLVAITVQWFTTSEQTMIVTIWQTMFALAGVVTSLFGFGFYQLPGATTHARTDGLLVWQWVILAISLISGLASAIVLFFLPDSPANARWASAEEKVRFVERVRANDQGIKQKEWRSDQAWEVVRDPLPYLLFGMIFFQTLVVGGLNTFNSILINSAFGFSVSVAQLLGIPLSFFQVILYLLIGWLGTKTRQTVLCMVAFICVNIIGTIVLITVAPNSDNKGGLLFCFYIMQCCQSVSPSMWAMLSRNVAGQTKKSIVYAIFFIGWAGGNAIGPQLFQSVWATRYLPTLYIHLGIYVLFIADVMTIRFICKRRNAKRDAALQGEQNIHAHAFEDRTDLQNAEFRYSY